MTTGRRTTIEAIIWRHQDAQAARRRAASGRRRCPACRPFAARSWCRRKWRSRPVTVRRRRATMSCALRLVHVGRRPGGDDRLMTDRASRRAVCWFGTHLPAYKLAVGLITGRCGSGGCPTLHNVVRDDRGSYYIYIFSGPCALHRMNHTFFHHHKTIPVVVVVISTSSGRIPVGRGHP